MSKMQNVMSIDVEDWFHILELESTPKLGSWDSLETRVENNLNTMLKDLDKYNVKATFFFLGWVAEKFPELVKLTHSQGHEIASHGYCHRLIYSQSREEFKDDITKAKKILENITGSEVIGYRAPGFSITEDTSWAMEELASAGFAYDSSVFPTTRGHGGLRSSRMEPHVIQTRAGQIIEMPISVKPFFGKRICFFGGGYLRLFPYSIIKSMTRKVNHSGRPVIYYIHPREIDPAHPRLPMGAVRRFKSYVNLKTTRKKFNSLLRDFELVSIKEWISRNRQLMENVND